MIYSIFAVLLAITVVLVLNTLRFRGKFTGIIESLPFELSDHIVDKLKRAVAIKSVSHSDYSLNDLEEFKKIIPFIENNYPGVISGMELEVMGDYSCILKWPGKDESVKPVLFLAHYDVVPVVPGKWSADPFGGEEKDGFIWGRGTLDTKNTFTALLESAEQLLSSGYTPDRTVYFAFGGDEETQGTEGAGRISAYFQKTGMEFDWLLDEGGVVAENALAMVKEPLALVGISEKGYVNIRIAAEGKGGHSSMPPAHSAAGLIARAVATMENRPFPAKLTPTVEAFLKGIVPFVSFPVAIVLANQRIFSPVIKKLLLAGDQTAALIRTTQAVTIIRSGKKENVLPSSGEAIINLRILPGETVDSTVKRVSQILKHQPVTVENYSMNDSNDPVEESELYNEPYRLIESVIGGVFKGAVTAPYMMTGATDSKHYRNVCRNIYRFSPMSLKSEEIALIHSADERISRENYRKAIQFYMTLLNEI
ncbi:M20/M25/M40 family metallo-hydrolase [Spirochaeta isovalerica]|uniref:Carboxypeptidase PM20D1 n=1 Tax=Spirochaeta isovalerica TaxID=150 RepID=A0A841RF27_9SPIO|nr:M20/M25/M40 family metallo-hydrolase [Spirochaeta isovalerica]MBB6481429.1 carboxypeptidase PM20D1 [Spirochaeta isovalerica]